MIPIPIPRSAKACISPISLEFDFKTIDATPTKNAENNRNNKSFLSNPEDCLLNSIEARIDPNIIRTKEKIIGMLRFSPKNNVAIIITKIGELWKMSSTLVISLFLSIENMIQIANPHKTPTLIPLIITMNCNDGILRNKKIIKEISKFTDPAKRQNGYKSNLCLLNICLSVRLTAA